MSEDKVRQQYNQLAPIYDHRWRNYLRTTLSFLNTWGQISSSATILDVACGTGELARLRLSQYPQQPITCTDISDPMLHQARQKLKGYDNVSFYAASAAELPFPSNHFEIVICASAFHYFDAPHAALKEMQRVLKPEGKVVLLDWCRDYLLCQICDWWLKLSDRAYQQCYTQTEFHTLLIESGLKIQRATQFRFDFVWGMMAVEAGKCQTEQP